MWTVQDRFLVVWLLGFLFTKSTLACGGFDLAIKKIHNCMDNGVIQLSNDFSVHLDKHCNIVPTGCFNITQDFADLKVKFTLNKPPWTNVTGTIDVCELTEKRSIVTFLLRVLGLPHKCPVTALTKCFEGKARYSVYFLKFLMSLAAGEIDLKVEGSSEKGASCIEISAVLSKI